MAQEAKQTAKIGNRTGCLFGSRRAVRELLPSRFQSLFSGGYQYS